MILSPFFSAGFGSCRSGRLGVRCSSFPFLFLFFSPPLKVVTYQEMSLCYRVLQICIYIFPAWLIQLELHGGRRGVYPVIVGVYILHPPRGELAAS
jgi:hypothetical protein